MGCCLHQEVVLGINQFLDFGFAYVQSHGHQKICCPYDKCTTLYMFTRNEILRHLYYIRFMGNYYVRRFHGEDNNFIQVDNEIPSAHIVGESEGFFGDGHTTANVQFPYFLQGTSY